MRNRIIDYTFTPGTRTITLTKFAEVTVPDLRLIVNETQKYIICSSMQKDLVTCSGNVITFVDTLPALQDRDQLTIEVDTGSDVIYSGGVDWVVEHKLNSIASPEEQQEWELTAEMAEQLRPLVEANRANNVFTDALNGWFSYSKCSSADLSGWTKIAGVRAAQSLFKYSYGLLSARFPNLQEINQDNAAQGLLQSCTALQVVDFSSLQIISGGAAASNLLQGCNALKVADFRSLQVATGTNAMESMLRECYALRKVDFRSLVSYPGYNYLFLGSAAIEEFHANVAVLSAAINSGQNILNTCTQDSITDMHLYGTPTADIHIEKAKPNFESVKGILEFLIAHPQGSTHTCYFRTGGMTIQDDADGTLTTLATQATSAGWSLPNITINS